MPTRLKSAPPTQPSPGRWQSKCCCPKTKGASKPKHNQTTLAKNQTATIKQPTNLLASIEKRISFPCTQSAKIPTPAVFPPKTLHRPLTPTHPFGFGNCEIGYSKPTAMDKRSGDGPLLNLHRSFGVNSKWTRLTMRPNHNPTNEN